MSDYAESYTLMTFTLKIVRDCDRVGARIMAAATALGLVATSSAAIAQAKPTSPGTSAQAAAAASAKGVDAFRQEAAKLGVYQCAAFMSVLGRTLTQGARYSVQTHADKSAPDTRPAQAVIGMNYNTPNYKGQAAGVVLAAPVGHSCQGQLVRVAPFQEPCQGVVARLPKGSAAAANLSGVLLYRLGGNQGQALFVPSGASCVVVTVIQAVQTR